MKPLLKRLLLSSLVFAGAAVLVRAEDLGAVRARMEQRLSKIDDLKAQGVIGENNRGFVEVRGGGGDAADVVAAENHDREAVYEAIAAKTGSSAAQVGRTRARQIAANSAAGVWLQRDTGEWYRK
jgi:uncharacterized protein YdbL (DUF1318 family)